MGTHPIFESDFDCLTENFCEKKLNMGEVRKRKPSKEQAVNGNSEVKVVESGGLGLIPVVLIAAVLAGSGCYVIKKDHAENFADLQKLTNQLKADNSNTLKAVDAMKSAIEQKDKIIKELQQKVNSGNEKNRLTDDKLNDIMSQVEEGTKGAQARQTKIEALEIALETAKKSTAASTEELRNLVETKSADNAELTAQSEKLAEVSGEISKINEKIEEVVQKLAEAQKPEPESEPEPETEPEENPEPEESTE